jgi:hypothetical protein
MSVDKMSVVLFLKKILSPIEPYTYPLFAIRIKHVSSMPLIGL